MSYITIRVRNEGRLTDYLLFHADYINEAWLAEVREDETTRIVREFACHDLMNCIDEIVLCADHLGRVTDVFGNDSEPAVVQALREKLLYPEPDTAAVIRMPLSLSLQPGPSLWDRLTRALPDLGMAG